MLLKGDILLAIEAGTAKLLSSQAANPLPAQTQSSTAAVISPKSESVTVSRRSVGRGVRSYEDIPLSKMRSVIASRLTASKTQIPHHYVSSSVNIDQLMKTRAELLDTAGVKLSVNDFIVRASALALRDNPQANAIFKDGQGKQAASVDISIAVATPSGLITPIITKAEQKRLLQISTETKELAHQAKEGTLQPAQFQGGTFTISNLGMYGVKEFKAIINMPQAMIMAVGGGQPVVRAKNADPTEETDQGLELEATSEMTVSMSCDERVVDAAVTEQFLASFKRYLEEPLRMLL